MYPRSQRFLLALTRLVNRHPSEEFNLYWNFADRLFKILQWLAFLAVIRFAADKSHSAILEAISGTLLVYLCLLTQIAQPAWAAYLIRRLPTVTWMILPIVLAELALSIGLVIGSQVAARRVIDEIIKATH